MRPRKIVRVFDTTHRGPERGRLILHLECQHNISLYEVDLVAATPSLRSLQVGDMFPCRHCPDESPAPKIVDKTAQGWDI